MKKKKTKSGLVFHLIRSPYRMSDTDTYSTLYQRYLEDPDAIFENEGLVYYKIIECTDFRVNGISILVTLDNRMGLRLGDKLIDDNGTIYAIVGFEMIRFASGIPDWFSKISFVALDGDPYAMGEYLARLPREEATPDCTLA